MIRDEWLVKRRGYLCASDVPVVLGVVSARGPLDIYNAKVHGYAQDDNEAMLCGRLFEPGIAELYKFKHPGNVVYDIGAHELQVHKEIDFMAATLDRMVYTDDLRQGPLEIKNLGQSINRERFETSPSLQFRVQNQMQMACTGYDYGEICAMYPVHQLAVAKQEYNGNFFKAIYQKLEDFWRCVEDKTPPKFSRNDTGAAVKELFPRETPGKWAVVPSDAMALVDAWQQARQSESVHGDEKEYRAGQLKQLMGDAEVGALVDGTFLTYKTDSAGKRVLRKAKRI